MNPARRRWLLQLAVWPAAVRGAGISAGRALRFPGDHGAHLESQIEWWYATGWLGRAERPRHGFQITFFRSRNDGAGTNPSRFAPRHLLFAHAALCDIESARHLHDQRIVRWSGAAEAAWGTARQDAGGLRIGRWALTDETSAWQLRVPARGFEIALRLARSQPLLLQGEQGYSRKGPEVQQASHYYSEPQLQVGGSVSLEGQAPIPSSGRAWLDHEWSDEILPPQAVGWDWIGMNLLDGSALTAFVLRREDGSALWAGGSWRLPGQAVRAFASSEVIFTPGRRWRSPGSAADYPVQWQVQTPAGSFEVRALLDAQELDSRASTGTIYWEGLSELRNTQGERVGLGYLEMTGYAGRLKLA